MAEYLAGRATKLWTSPNNGGYTGGDIVLSQAYTDFNYLLFFMTDEDDGDGVDIAIVAVNKLEYIMSRNPQNIGVEYPGHSSITHTTLNYNRSLISPSIANRWTYVCANYLGSSSTLFKYVGGRNDYFYTIWGVK